MAYFDSAKNRAMWQKELAGLRAEKMRRLSEGTEVRQPMAAQEREAQTSREMRERTSYMELLREEAEAAGASKAQRQRMTQKVKEQGLEKNSLQRTL